MDLQLTGHLIGGQLVRAFKAHQRLASERLRRLGLYPGQEMLLLALEREDGQSQSQIAARHGVDLSTVTKVAQRMERAGLLQRRPDAEDARISRLYLSERGRALCPEARELWRELEERLVGGLSEAERALLHRLLAAAAANLEQ